MTLRSYKVIAERINKIWGGVGVSIPAVIRWSKMIDDPLPIKRIKPAANTKRSIVFAETAAVERWAQRRLP